MFENKKIFILGMARSGYSAAKVLAKRNNQIVLNDKNSDQDKEHIKELEGLGISEGDTVRMYGLSFEYYKQNTIGSRNLEPAD